MRNTVSHVGFFANMFAVQAYELSVLTGTQVLLLVVSETGLVYTFTTPKLQPLVTKPEGKNLIQVSLSSLIVQSQMMESNTQSRPVLTRQSLHLEMRTEQTTTVKSTRPRITTLSFPLASPAVCPATVACHPRT